MCISDIDGLINDVSNDLSACLGMGMDDCIKDKHIRMPDSYPSLLKSTEQAMSDTGSEGSSNSSGEPL